MKFGELIFRKSLESHIPLGKFTALPQAPWLDLRGPASKRMEGRGREGRAREGGREN